MSGVGKKELSCLGWSSMGGIRVEECRWVVDEVKLLIMG